eukprot:SAG31_NODE_15033_length_774_cov_0.743704_2_plen_46_part_01
MRATEQAAIPQQKDEIWDEIARIDTEQLLRLIFDTIDSDGNNELNR